MNVVNALFERESGKRAWWDYNIALRRLKCHDYDEFKGILPSTEGPDFNPEPPVFACTFCSTPNNEHLLALANEDGKISIQDTTKRSDHNPLEGYQAHHNAIFDIAWAPQEMRLVSASGDHTAVLWDVQETGQLQEVARFHAHTRSVKTVTFPREDKMVFATGARDGVIMLWDTRIQRNQLSIRPDNFICNSHSAPGTPGSSSASRNRRMKTAPSRASSITGLLFQDSHSLISCGAGDGKIKVWDVRKCYSTYRREPQPKYSMSTPNGSGRSGFTCLALDPGGLKLFASCMDNTIYCYNIATYEEQPITLYKGHKNGTFYVKACLSPDGRYLLSGSSDEMAYIWDTYSVKREVTTPIVKLVGHGAEVTSVAWCPVGEVKIVTCSDDARHCLWRIGSEFRGDNHQIELHGWAEDLTDKTDKALVSSPATPATPSFTAWRRWTPCILRTPDNEELLSTACDVCHCLSTPCMRCIAMRAPLPLSVPNGSKKRLEVLWEEDLNCPECEREGRPILSQVSNNLDAPARRLFSPSKRKATEETDSVNSFDKESNTAMTCGVKRQATDDKLSSDLNEPSPKKSLTTLDFANTRRTSPRKRCHDFQTGTPEKRFKVNENASCSRNHDELSSGILSANDDVAQLNSGAEPSTCCSPQKKLKLSPESIPVASLSPNKGIGSPFKRRISERRTDSPHKRFPTSDDLSGITKIEDNIPTVPPMRQRKLCARHSRTGFNSPTLNLPNYVLDGTSPHHRCSPARHHKENVDWLTRLRRERNSTEKKPEPDSASDLDAAPSHPTNSRRRISQRTPGKPNSTKITPAKNTTSRVTPAKSFSKRTTPAKSSNSTTPAKSGPSISTVASKKTPSRRPSAPETSINPSTSSGNSTSLLRFFRVSEKPIEPSCSIGNSTTSKSVSSVML
ncbi:Protein lethal(2)denticleless [Frankliniella fusca]|uniref:Protein lethal(2)denticleless n=1 Tax=Frankliniella fusca TaxID=407009 RepID=A0AAE1LKX0_9NEOP|nr:Protein lethal(2)denticleless [Frankliniella fusca]